MDSKDDETRWKSINEVAYLGTAAHLLAEAHFPNDCSERQLLLDISDAISKLWSVNFALEATIRQIDEMRRLSVDEQIDVMEMSLMLECLAGTHSVETSTICVASARHSATPSAIRSSIADLTAYRSRTSWRCCMRCISCS
jgi:hypothetical protein